MLPLHFCRGALRVPTTVVVRCLLHGLGLRLFLGLGLRLLFFWLSLFLLLRWLCLCFLLFGLGALFLLCRLSLFFVLRWLCLLFVLCLLGLWFVVFVLRERRMNGSKKQEKCGCANQSECFHQYCLHYGDFVRQPLFAAGAVNLFENCFGPGAHEYFLRAALFVQECN